MKQTVQLTNQHTEWVKADAYPWKSSPWRWNTMYSVLCRNVEATSQHYTCRLDTNPSRSPTPSLCLLLLPQTFLHRRCNEALLHQNHVLFLDSSPCSGCRKLTQVSSSCGGGRKLFLMPSSYIRGIIFLRSFHSSILPA